MFEAVLTKLMYAISNNNNLNSKFVIPESGELLISEMESNTVHCEKKHIDNLCLD